jgi:hypothetical protein
VNRCLPPKVARPERRQSTGYDRPREGFLVPWDTTTCPDPTVHLTRGQGVCVERVPMIRHVSAPDLVSGVRSRVERSLNFDRRPDGRRYLVGEAYDRVGRRIVWPMDEAIDAEVDRPTDQRFDPLTDRPTSGSLPDSWSVIEPPKL